MSTRPVSGLTSMEILTTGIAMGEFFHKLALYVNSSPTRPTGFKNFARIVTGPTVALTRWLDDDTRLGKPPPDELGFSSQIHHDFGFHYGFWRSDDPSADSLDRHELGFRGKLVAIPGYQEPGAFSRTQRSRFTRSWPQSRLLSIRCSEPREAPPETQLK